MEFTNSHWDYQLVICSKDQKVKQQNRFIDISNSKFGAFMIGFKCYWINDLKKTTVPLLGLGLRACALAMKSPCSLAHVCSGSGAVRMAVLKGEMGMIEDMWSVRWDDLPLYLL